MGVYSLVLIRLWIRKLTKKRICHVNEEMIQLNESWVMTDLFHNRIRTKKDTHRMLFTSNGWCHHRDGFEIFPFGKTVDFVEILKVLLQYVAVTWKHLRFCDNNKKRKWTVQLDLSQLLKILLLASFYLFFQSISHDLSICQAWCLAEEQFVNYFSQSPVQVAICRPFPVMPKFYR